MPQTNDCKDCGDEYPKTSPYNQYRLCTHCARGRLTALRPGQVEEPPTTRETIRAPAPSRVLTQAAARKRADRLDLVNQRKAAAYRPDTDRAPVKGFFK